MARSNDQKLQGDGALLYYGAKQLQMCEMKIVCDAYEP